MTDQTVSLHFVGGPKDGLIDTLPPVTERQSKLPYCVCFEVVGAVDWVHVYEGCRSDGQSWTLTHQGQEKIDNFVARLV